MAITKASVRLPAFLTRALKQSTTIEVDGGDSASASAKYSLYKPDGTTAQIDNQTATHSSGVLTYTMEATAIPATLTCADGWQERWVVTRADSTTFTVLRPAAITLYALHCTIVNSDILRERPEWSTYPTGETSWEKQIDMAWWWVCRLMINRKDKPYLHLAPDALFFPVLYRACANVARVLATYVNGRQMYAALAAEYDVLADEAFGDMVPIYDTDADQVVDTGEADVPHPNRWVIG